MNKEEIIKNATDLSFKIVDNATDKDGNIDIPLLMVGVSLALDKVFNAISKGDEAVYNQLYNQLWNIMVGSINIVKDNKDE